METLKKPIWRVPLVLAGAGILCRFLTYLIAIISVQIQRAQGPDPVTGAYNISTTYITEITTVLAFLIFWAAGWLFVRTLRRKEIFFSATIMVIWGIALLAWEQISQAMGGYSMWCHRLYATKEAMMWVNQILIWVFDQVSLPVMVPGLFAPYLYLVFGKKRGINRIDEKRTALSCRPFSISFCPGTSRRTCPTRR